MNAATHLPDETLNTVLQHYNIGALVRAWPAANGIENQNYFVQTHSKQSSAHGPLEVRQEYVLTVLQQPSYAPDHYDPLMLTLSAAGLPVAEPLPTTTGERRSELDGRPAMLQRRLPGSHVFNPTTNQLSAVGRFLGRMHRACAGAELQLPNHPRDLSWVNTQAAAIKSYLGYDDQLLLDQSIESVTSLLGRRDVKSLPQGTLHADLFRDNVLFNEDGLSGVLDFHHASSGTLMFDLAVTANDWCTDASGELDPDRTLTLLRAYNEIRPLTEQEIWFFSGFALFAALTFWLSREIVLVPDPTGQSTPPVRTKNPKEFRNVVEHHLRRTFYIDRRHLQL